MSPPIKRPRGFTLLAVLLGIAAVGGFLDAAFPDVGGDQPPGVQAVWLVWVVFAAVAAEALWRCRSWCVRATAVCGCASLVSYLVRAAAMPHADPAAWFFGLLLRVIVVWLAVQYVHERAARLFGPPRGAVPIAVPRP